MWSMSTKPLAGAILSRLVDVHGEYRRLGESVAKIWSMLRFSDLLSETGVMGLERDVITVVYGVSALSCPSSVS